MVGRLLPTLALFLAFIAGLLHGVAATTGDTYTYDFIVNVVNAESADGPVIEHITFDGVAPTEDMFTVSTTPLRQTCYDRLAGQTTGCVGLTDGDINTHSSWEPGDSVAGTELFKISSATRVSEIKIWYYRPQHAPGWLIKENGVELIRETANRGSNFVDSPAIYTYNLPTYDADTGCVSFAPSYWNFVGGPEFRQSTATTPDYIHFKPACLEASDGYVEGNVSTTPGVTYVVKVELGVVTISGASDSRSLITTVGQASQTFDASALVSRTDRSLYEWVEAATFTAAANSFSTTLRFEEGNFNCMDMKDVELCPVPSLSPLLSLKQQVGLWFRMDEYTDPPGTNAPPASFGSAMMIEDDTMAVGAPGADDFQGIVEVYARDSPGDLNSSWTKVAEIPGNGGWFGGTLAIDGDTLVIGANENNANYGAAYVYRRELPGDPTSGWSLVVKLTSGSEGQFGRSVAIDGDIIVIGAWASDFVAVDAGSVHVFTRDTPGDLTSGWTEVHRLNASDGAADDRFGSSVSIDGDTMVIGAAYRNNREGVSYVFTRETPGDLGSEWIEVARLDPPAGSGEKHHFGYSVSIDADTIAIGAAGYGFASGSGYVFVRDTPGNLSSGWSQVARLHPLVNNEPVTDIFESRSISLERDAILFGTTLGTAFLFTRDTPGDLNSAWRQNTEITYDNPWYPLTSSNFGWVVSISGETVAVAGRGLDTGYHGSAYVFSLDAPPCNASGSITNGDVGDCNAELISGSSCQPTCDGGFMILRERSCVRGVLYDAAACVNFPPPPPPSPPSPPPPPPPSPPPPAPPPPLLRLHLVADDMNATSHTQNLVWRDRSSFGNDLTPHLAAPEVIEDAFNGHKALRFGFSDLFQDGVEGFSCMRLDPAASDNLLTYGESHWSFPGVTVFAVIEPRDVPWGGDGDPLDFVFDFGEFPARGFGLAWHENERTLYTPTDHGGEVRRSAEHRENKKYVVAIQYTFGQDGHVRALTQFATRHGRADLIDRSESATQAFSVHGFTPDTVAHEQSPFSVGCMSKENTASGVKGKRVFRGDIAELRLYAGLLSLDEVFAIRDVLVDTYVPECERECSTLTRRGLNQVNRYDEPAVKAPVSEEYKCIADGECISARSIRIYKAGTWPSHIINLQELVIWSSAFPDINLAAGKAVTCSPACSSSGQNVVDGSSKSIAHTCYEGNSGTRGDLAEGACNSTIPKSIEIDLGQEYLIDGMLIINRLDAYRIRIQNMKVDFKDADGNVVLTTAAITSDKSSEDGYVMDLTKTTLQSNVEFDAWKYIPEGDVVKVADFDWRPYKRWCAVNEYWDGAACRDCPVATRSRGGDVTMCCAADEFWNGQACGACPTGSIGMQYVMCTCATDEFWNGTACQTCPTGSFSAGGSATTTSCTSCEADEFWNGTACQTCPAGEYSLGGNMTSSWCTDIPEFCSDDPGFTGIAVRDNGIVQYCEDGWTLVKKFKENTDLFHFDDPLWETDGTLLPAGEDILPSPHASADAQYPTYGSTPLSKIRVKSNAGEITIDLGTLDMSYMSLTEIFTGNQVLTPWLTMDDWNNVFPHTGQRVCDPAQNMGLNSRCMDNARTRIGFCGNLPEQACQNSNTDDADYAFGLGLNNQVNCKVGAGWTCGYDAYWGYSKSHDATLWVSAGKPIVDIVRCASNEYWDGTSCAACAEGSFSAGGSATTTSCTSCEADEFWNGQACATNQIKHALSQGSGPTIWYTTANASSVLKGSQGEVTGWTDATGNGYDIGAGTDVHAPTLETSTNGKYAVRVGGDPGKYLRSADLFVNMGLADIPPPFTVMAVMKINSGSAYLMDDYGLDKFVVAIDNGDNIFPFPTTYSAWRGTGGASLTGNCGFPSAGWGVHEWVFSNTAGETAIYKADGTAPCIDAPTDKMKYAYNLTGLTIGEDGGLRTTIIDPDVSWREFMIFPGTLTRQESARYREYLDNIAS